MGYPETKNWGLGCEFTGLGVAAQPQGPNRNQKGSRSPNDLLKREEMGEEIETVERKRGCEGPFVKGKQPSR